MIPFTTSATESHVAAQGTIEQRSILVNVRIGKSHTDADEFRDLAISAGAEPVAFFSLIRQKINPQYLIGKGKAIEIADEVVSLSAQLVLFDHPLTPSQERNLERLMHCRVFDRRMLILSIFAQRARTHEAKLQVELAQLQYLSPRLVRGWTHLEKQSGGIGVRGPGETQLETDRRLIRHRIKHIRQQLDQVRSQRRLNRRVRTRSDTALASLVGYTNAGKSTLFNALTHAGVGTADMLFQTLTTTVRKVEYQGKALMIADTVGFIDALPHDLIAAFRATLEEITEAALLLHVVDVSTAGTEQRIKQVNAVLKSINATNRQIIIYNKCDKVPKRKININGDDSEGENDLPASSEGNLLVPPSLTWPRTEYDSEGSISHVWISAEHQVGLDAVLEAIAQQCLPLARRWRFRFPASAGRLRAYLYQEATVVDEVALADGGWELTAELTQTLYEKLQAKEGLATYQIEWN